MPYRNLLLERRERVAIMTLNRPAVLNAIGDGLQDECRGALLQLAADDEVWAVILTGAGRGFCSGADLAPSQPSDTPPPVRSHEERLDEYGWVGRQALAFYGFPKPLIAAVNGPAVGAGMSMALACDLRVGSELTRFKTAFIERSLSPDSGMSYLLPRLVGYSKAVDLIFTSRMVDGDEAYRLGLLDRLVPSASLLDEATAIAAHIATLPPLAMRSAKRVLQRAMDVDLEDAVRYESNGLKFSRLAQRDAAESLASFLERRPPRFTGE